MALAMLHPGAKGLTANCLSKALFLPGNVETACEELDKLVSTMKVSEANNIFCHFPFELVLIG
jgi:hypothetical protein